MPAAIDGLKLCTKCKTVKPVCEFYKNNSTADLLDHACKNCNTAARKARELRKGVKHRKPRPYDYEVLDDNTAAIPVRFKEHWFVALVDVEDAIWLSKYKWNLNESGYAVANIKGQMVRMHRMIMHSAPDQIVDHQNGYRADNRRKNLRHVDAALNSRNAKSLPSHNTSGYVGVHWSVEKQRWKAESYLNNRNKHIGYYDTKIEAARAYNNFVNSLNLPPPYRLNVIDE
jgi:hypothetical protein